MYSFVIAEDDDGHKVGRDGIFIYVVVCLDFACSEVPKIMCCDVKKWEYNFRMLYNSIINALSNPS